MKLDFVIFSRRSGSLSDESLHCVRSCGLLLGAPMKIRRICQGSYLVLSDDEESEVGGFRFEGCGDREQIEASAADEGRMFRRDPSLGKLRQGLFNKSCVSLFQPLLDRCG